MPPDLPGTCLPACLISLVETLSGPWEPAHLSPVSPPRAGSDMAPCLGPWNPGCQRLCRIPSHLRGRLSPERQSRTPSPIAPDLSPRPAPCQGPCVLLVAQPVPWGPGPLATLLHLGGARPPPQSERDRLKLQAVEHALPWELCLPLLPVWLSRELFLLIIPECWWARPGPASYGQHPGVQAHPEPGARPAPAPWCWHSLPLLLLPSARGSVLAPACLEPPHAQRRPGPQSEVQEGGAGWGRLLP